MLISRSAFGVQVAPPSVVFQMPPATPAGPHRRRRRRVDQERARAAADIAGSHGRPGAAKARAGGRCHAEGAQWTLWVDTDESIVHRREDGHLRRLLQSPQVVRRPDCRLPFRQTLREKIRQRVLRLIERIGRSSRPLGRLPLAQSLLTIGDTRFIALFLERGDSREFSLRSRPRRLGTLACAPRQGTRDSQQRSSDQSALFHHYPT